MRKYIVALSAAAGLLVFGAAGAQAATHPHHAISNATSACGAYCSDYSSLLLGPGTIMNAYVAGDTGAVPSHPGQPVNLKYASNSHPNEDFTLQQVGTVSQFCGSLLNSASVACIDFAGSEPSGIDYPAYELNWTPYGNESGYCAGTVGTPYNGKQVKLVTCGKSEGSLLIDEGNDLTTGGLTYDSYITGATSQFSHPYVLSVDPGSAGPANQVRLSAQNSLTGGVAKDSEMFAATAGPAA